MIRLITYVRSRATSTAARSPARRCSPATRWTCQYCGSDTPGLTVDHVIPRSRGGVSVWENIVAACAPCNRRKGNRLPREIEMHPRDRAETAGPDVFIRIAAPKVPPTWEPYLAMASA